MSRKTIYLHIGRGKTGTTAIQGFLSANRLALLAQGVHYIFADDAGRGWGHQDFAKSFIDRPPAYMQCPAEPDRVRAAVREEMRNVQVERILLSSENLTMANIDRLSRFLEESLGSVAVRVIFFARSQDELAESQYNQMIKFNKTRATFDEFVAQELNELDYNELLAPWANRFGLKNIRARIFDAGGTKVLEDLISCLDLPGALPDAVPAKESTTNASVGILALETFRVLNRFQLPRRPALYQQLHQQMQPIDQPALFFSAAEARAFRARFGASNRAFSRAYLGRETDDLGGRKYSDEQREEILGAISRLRGL